MASTLYCGALVPQDGSAIPSGTCDILVEETWTGRIAPKDTLTADTVGDVSGTIAAPSLVNGHLHSWYHVIKGRAENLPVELVMAHPRPMIEGIRRVYDRALASETDPGIPAGVFDTACCGARP